MNIHEHSLKNLYNCCQWLLRNDHLTFRTRCGFFLISFAFFKKKYNNWPEKCQKINDPAVFNEKCDLQKKYLFFLMQEKIIIFFLWGVTQVFWFRVKHCAFPLKLNVLSIFLYQIENAESNYKSEPANFSYFF